MKKLGFAVLGVVGFFAFIIIVGTSTHEVKNQQALVGPKPRNFGEESFYIAQKLVENRLKAPSTAKFSTLSDASAGYVAYGENRWACSGYVDAQNAFSAMIREKWFAVMTNNNGVLEPVYMEVGSHKYGELPMESNEPKN